MKESYLRLQTKLVDGGVECKVRRHGPNHNGAAIVRVVIPWELGAAFPTDAIEALMERVRTVRPDGTIGLNAGLGGNG